MARISLEERIKGDGSLSSFICQERFLDLKISDWISHKRSNILNDSFTMSEMTFSAFYLSKIFYQIRILKKPMRNFSN